MDICETEDEVIVALELPGVRPEEIEVTQHEDRIIVRGLRRPHIPDRPKHFHQIEIVCGAFEKEIIMPPALRGGRVEASLGLGILTLRVYKADMQGASLETKIEIDSE